MFCIHCGAENPDGSKFCSDCGKPLSDAPAVKAAPVAQPQKAAVPQKAASEKQDLLSRLTLPKAANTWLDKAETLLSPKLGGRNVFLFAMSCILCIIGLIALCRLPGKILALKHASTLKLVMDLADILVIFALAGFEITAGVFGIIQKSLPLCKKFGKVFFILSLVEVGLTIISSAIRLIVNARHFTGSYITDMVVSLLVCMPLTVIIPLIYLIAVNNAKRVK